MKHPLKYVLILAAGLSLLATTSVARVGESRQSLESRLIGNGLAIPYPKDEVLKRLRDSDPNHKRIEQLLNFRYGSPSHHSSEVKAFLSQLSDEIQKMADATEHALYFKPYDKSKASRTDINSDTNNRNKKFVPRNGWQFYVIYFNGKSIFESYRKVGAALVEAESNQILVMNSNQQAWKKRDKAPASDSGEEATLSFFNYELFRADELTRASKIANGICIYDAHFDTNLARKSKDIKAAQKNAEENNIGTSLLGF